MRSCGDGMPARRAARVALLARLRLGEAAMAHQHFDDLVADRIARIERGHRLLEDHREAVAAHVAQFAIRQVEQPDAVERHGAGNFRALFGQQAHHGQRSHALAATGFADEAERRAARDREIDAIDRDGAAAAIAMEHDAQILDRQQRRGHHFCLGAARQRCRHRSPRGRTRRADFSRARQDTSRNAPSARG